MPIFQDDFGSRRATPPPAKPSRHRSTSPSGGFLMERKDSEESIRTELCEGPVSNVVEEDREFPTTGLHSTLEFPVQTTSDRVELIDRLTRGQSPDWLPNRNVKTIRS